MNARADFSNARALVRSTRRARAFLRPPPDLKPSEWAEQNIKIPIGNAVPGPMRFDNAPYQREVIDMTADPRCNRISLMWGAQVGKTQTALAAQAFRIGFNPVSQMMMQPSQGDLTTWLETKFNPLVEENDGLAEVLAKPRARHGVNNQRMKSYPGGFLMFSWSGSPKTMRGRSAPFIVCDETDGYDRTNEGHPVGLLWQRAATFGDQRLLLEISTPTIKGGSWIEKAFDQGDQRYFYVRCPHCGHLQKLDWSQVTWSKDADGVHLAETAGYLCAGEGCGTVWSDGERCAAIRNAEREGGGWIATKPFRGHASYHLSELYSCFRRLEDIVQSFLDKRAAGDLQTFVNVSLAQTWEEEGDKLEASVLMARATKFAAPVPMGAGVLTAGIDMQNDRLEVEIVAWGLGEESWSVDYKTLWGDPLQQDVWDELDALLSETWQHESGAELRISAACLDTGGEGGRTQAAYDYARKRLGRKVWAIKGVGGWGRPIVTAPSKIKQRGTRPVYLHSVGVDEAKAVVAQRARIKDPGPGHCHFPEHRDPAWFDMFTAEALRTRYVKGFAVREWHNVRPRNEAFDCRVYAYAALRILRPNVKRLVEALHPQDEEIEAEIEDTAAEPVAPPEAAAEGNPPEEPEPKTRQPVKKRGWAAKKRRRRH
ncbi:phage terminase large subunit family protein [Tritonibacter mobilis]|uniref:phage terminase large subunit family protein n=1 Tax=Tritonibacter mobilis TaxID=379347 RepID=UPI0008068D24|nr:phage terminase large subunit family protein [Tritonibacter mobilis]